MIRIAAVGDLHFGTDTRGLLRDACEHLGDQADVFLIAGDLTKAGRPEEAKALARDLEGIPIPTIAVLGNHDYHSGFDVEIHDILEKSGVRTLEGDAVVLDVGDVRVGIAGIKGFGGGFAGACGSDFGEPEMKAFIRHTKLASERLGRALASLEADAKIALLHYSPIPGTLQGERLEIFPFLGSYLLAEPVDRIGADLVLHGHAHAGTEKGVTPGGIRVRNVAQPVIKSAYALYSLTEPGHVQDAPEPAAQRV